MVLAKALGGRVVTNDFNLNKIAQLQGVEVINLNELANALKTVALPGESLHGAGRQAGRPDRPGRRLPRRRHDGGGRAGADAIGQDVTITVTSVLQTPAGRMIFGRPDQRPSGSPTPYPGPGGASGAPGDSRFGTTHGRVEGIGHTRTDSRDPDAAGNGDRAGISDRQSALDSASDRATTDLWVSSCFASRFSASPMLRSAGRLTLRGLRHPDRSTTTETAAGAEPSPRLATDVELVERRSRRARNTRTASKTLYEHYRKAGDKQRSSGSRRS